MSQSRPFLVTTALEPEREYERGPDKPSRGVAWTVILSLFGWAWIALGVIAVLRSL